MTSRAPCAGWENRRSRSARRRSAPLRGRRRMRGRNFLTGFLLAAGSAAGTVLYRRRAARRRERGPPYFGDGSMVSLPEGSPEAERLLAHARKLLSAARA